MRITRRFVSAFFLLLGLAAHAHAQRAAEQSVDLALVLAVDASGSVDRVLF